MPLYFEIITGCTLAICITLFFYVIKKKCKKIENAIESYDLSLKNVEISVEKEMKYLNKIKNLNEKIRNCPSKEKKELLNSFLNYLNVFYKNKKKLTELSRNIVSYNLKIKEILIKFYSEENVTQVRIDEFAKIKSIPKDLNISFEKLYFEIEKLKGNFNGKDEELFLILNEIDSKFKEISFKIENSVSEQNAIIILDEIML